MSLDWTGGFHESGHNVFDNTNRLHDDTDVLDAQIAIADPLDGCMGVPMDGSAATGDAITGSFADGSMDGKIALIRRGACYFTSKAINAQNAGAIAVVVYNDDRDGTVVMSGPDVGITIPTIFIDGRVGDSINEAVTADPSIVFSMHCDTETRYSGVPRGATLVGESAYGQLVRDTQIEYVNLPLDYEIGLDITPGPNIIGDWSSIVHFTATNTNCCDYGSRIPGVWFWPGTRKILVVDGHGANGNAHTGEWGCDDSILTLDEGTTYRLQMVMSAEVVQILVDGALACTSTRADRSVQENVKVYMADPWYAAADAVCCRQPVPHRRRHCRPLMRSSNM